MRRWRRGSTMRCSRRMWNASGFARGVALAALITGLARIGVAQAPALGAMQGEVVDSAGTPLRGAIVRLPATGGRTLTNAAGRFLFEGLTPGRHEIVGVMIGFLASQDSA